MIKKLNLFDSSDVRERILSGVTKMNNLVSMTLGPNGQSILIERGAGEPLLVDDGRMAAENIKFEDPLEQLAARVFYGVTRKTDEKVGDGTTTSMLLAWAIMKEVSKEYISFGIGPKANIGEIDKLIQKSKENIFKKLDEMKKEIKTEKELAHVASISAGDEELGKIIAGMYWKLGNDGHITLEFNLLSEEIETETIPGYRFTGSYAANWMITDADKKECDIPDVDVLVVHQKLTDPKEIEPIANLIGNSGKNKFVIIAPKFGESVIKMAFQNATRKKGKFYMLLVRAPGRSEEAYKDMAIFSGGKFFSANDDIKIAEREDLGYVSRINVTEDTVILMDGKGTEKDIKKRVEEVIAEAKLTKMPQFKQDRLERASALSGGVGVIRIGAPTDDKRNWLKHKIEDAKYATKHAYRDGIVQGGGLAFKKISESLPDDDILKKVLMAPYEKLKENNGGILKVGKNVYDPVAIEKAALDNACSAASNLLKIGGAIVHKPEPELDTLLRNNNKEEMYDPEDE